ncbi:unnamed protein product [Rhizoctonia solani]|uniref:Uncharacterized protein n=1 Tax=Rhizoctonia solani TaxID=456999 RepID=A0A8H2XHX0_9AGAM|nr:unnamed protein product [Rhizoctonia solani]
MRVERVCIGLAWCAQLVTIVLENVANPYGAFWSSWGAINLMSIISLIALTTHLLLPLFPSIWRILVIILLPERLRKPNSSDTSSEEPLLPAYSAHPTENLEVQILDESVAGPEDPLDFDSVAVQNHSDSSEGDWKGGYAISPAEDLERGDVGDSA